MTAPSWSTLARASGRAIARRDAASGPCNAAYADIMRAVQDDRNLPAAMRTHAAAVVALDAAQAARDAAHAAAVRAYAERSLVSP